MAHPLRYECPGEILPDILFRTAYVGLTARNHMTIRFVEAIGLDAAPPIHPLNGQTAVRYRDIQHSRRSIGSAKYCAFDDFMLWMQQTGASVDLLWSHWAHLEMSPERVA